jgi:hypothetical protein
LIKEGRPQVDFFRRLFGDTLDPEPQPRPDPRQARNPFAADPRQSRSPRGERSEDERALERYRYLLRTAPPETLEEAHAEAFAQLTLEQRRMVLQELTQDLPDRERAAVAGAGDDPRTLARVATRAEVRQPGTLERRFGAMGGPGIGLGGMMAGNFLSTIAGVMVGTAIADAFFADTGYSDGGDLAGADAAATETGDAGFGTGDIGDSGESGGFGDFGGDVGADFGDFGGGDF